MESILVEGRDAEKAYGRLLEETPGAPAQLSLEWRNAVIQAYPKLENGYYLLEDGGEAKFGFASLYAESLLFGDRVISLPFVDHGGFVATPGTAGAALVFSHLRSRFSTDKIEARLCEASPHFRSNEKALYSYGFHKHSTRSVAVVRLHSQEKMWKSFGKHTRNDVRKAEKSGLQLVEMNSQKEIDSFYKLYFHAMKKFGTPQHSKKFFESLQQNLGSRAFFGWNCYKEGTLAGSLVMLALPNNANGHGNSNGATASIAFNVSNPGLREFRPNDLLYWHALKIAASKKFESVDLGQVQTEALPGSHGHGILEFKRKWNAFLYATPRYYFGYGKKFEEQMVSGEAGGSKSAHLQKVWRMLPNPALKKLGPWVARQLCA